LLEKNFSDVVSAGAIRPRPRVERRNSHMRGWNEIFTKLAADVAEGARHMITISAFKKVPEFAQGQVRDLRARWALEEAGLPYKTRLLQQGDQDKQDYRALQPFGQVPILEEDGLVLFESGAIVLYIGERSERLLPKDSGARCRATNGSSRRSIPSSPSS
jgi:Glutathione S-transferase, N-terminal domain